jgi:hypothetical protein
MVTVSGSRLGSGRVAMWRVPRTRGAASGILLVLLGAWGALVPFVGPHFGYAYTPNATWTMTAGRLWLEVVPGAVAVIGGLILIGSASRAIGLWAGWLTAVAGAWFAIGPVLSRLWAGQPQPGSPVGGSTVTGVVEEIGFFTGLGVVIVFLAATALGRFSVIGVKEHMVATAARETAVDEPAMTEQRADDPAMSAATTRMPIVREREREREPKHAADMTETGRESSTETDAERPDIS